MPEKKFELGDYVEVKDRIKLFYELFGQGRLVTGEVRLTTEPDGVPRVMVQGLAYRTPDDPLPGVGWSWLQLPGSTPYTRGSEIENAETSAWGRAIGALGILIDRSIASQQEVSNKQGEQERPVAARGFVETAAHPIESPDPAASKDEIEELTGRVRRRGIIRKGTSDDYKLTARPGPEGHGFGFRLEIDGDKAIPQCVLSGAIGEAVYQATGEQPESLIGTPATVAGILYHVRKPGRAGSWYRLYVDRIETTIRGLEVIFPADPASDPVPVDAPPDDVPLFAEMTA